MEEIFNNYATYYNQAFSASDLFLSNAKLVQLHPNPTTIFEMTFPTVDGNTFQIIQNLKHHIQLPLLHSQITHTKCIPVDRIASLTSTRKLKSALPQIA